MRFARLAGSLLRRSLQSNQPLINHVQSRICSSSRGLVNSSDEKVLWSNAILGLQFWNPSRAFHGARPMAQDYYDVLGVSKNASESEIKKTFDAAERKFQEIQHAYEILKDKEKRSFYDQVGPDQYENAASGGAASKEPFIEGSGGEPSEEVSGGGMSMGGMDDESLKLMINAFLHSFGFTFFLVACGWSLDYFILCSTFCFLFGLFLVLLS